MEGDDFIIIIYLIYVGKLNKHRFCLYNNNVSKRDHVLYSGSFSLQ